MAGQCYGRSREEGGANSVLMPTTTLGAQGATTGTPNACGGSFDQFVKEAQSESTLST